MPETQALLKETGRNFKLWETAQSNSSALYGRKKYKARHFLNLLKILLIDIYLIFKVIKTFEQQYNAPQKFVDLGLITRCWCQISDFGP